MSGALKAKIIVVVVLLALTAALVGTCIAYRNRACEHTSLEHIEAVEPTCTESGNIEHWACKRCGATFKDEAGAEEIGRVVRTALGHDLTRHSAVEPTCTEARSGQRRILGMRKMRRNFCRQRGYKAFRRSYRCGIGARLERAGVELVGRLFQGNCIFCLQ